MGEAERKSSRALGGVGSLLGKLGLFATSLLLCILIGEWFVRSLSPIERGFHYNPRSGRFHHPIEYAYNDSTNSLGFHDVELGSKRTGIPRVMILGDSYVHGYWGPAREAIGQRLEWYLRKDKGERIDVVATGKATWSQREELGALERFGSIVEPDLVLSIFLPFNDVAENSQRLRDRVARQLEQPDFTLRPGWTRHSASEMPFFYFKSSILNQMISHRIAGSRGIAQMKSHQDPSSIPLHYFVYRSQDDEIWREAWQETEQLMVETRDRALAMGARFAVASASTPRGIRGPEAGLDWLVASHPAMADLEWDLEGPNRRMAEILRRHEIPFLNMEPAFRDASAQGRELHWRFDGHWNREGVDFAAQQLADFVVELLPASSAK